MTYNIRYIIFSLALFIISGASAQTTAVNPFDKIIISPHIQATFVEGNEESVHIESTIIDTSKIHIEVDNKTLRVYLEGAKEIEKNETTRDNGYKEKHSLYQGTVVTATITYKTLHELSLRGDEKQLCKSAIKGDKFILRIYGESDVTVNEINTGELETTIYGESNLKFLAGSVAIQKYTAYGEGKINSLAISGTSSYITAYGEASFKMNVSDKINLTTFGEAKLFYTGNPVIKKGLQIGNVQVEKIK